MLDIVDVSHSHGLACVVDLLDGVKLSLWLLSHRHCSLVRDYLVALPWFRWLLSSLAAGVEFVDFLNVVAHILSAVGGLLKNHLDCVLGDSRIWTLGHLEVLTWLLQSSLLVRQDALVDPAWYLACVVVLVCHVYSMLAGMSCAHQAIVARAWVELGGSSHGFYHILLQIDWLIQAFATLELLLVWRRLGL